MDPKAPKGHPQPSSSANSFWNIKTAQRNAGRWAKSLKVKGEEILGRLGDVVQLGKEHSWYAFMKRPEPHK